MSESKILLGYVRPDGGVMVDEDLQNENDIWRVMTGWGGPLEIMAWKEQGARIAMFEVKELTE